MCLSSRVKERKNVQKSSKPPELLSVVGMVALGPICCDESGVSQEEQLDAGHRILQEEYFSFSPRQICSIVISLPLAVY